MEQEGTGVSVTTVMVFEGRLGRPEIFFAVAILAHGIRLRSNFDEFWTHVCGVNRCSSETWW